MTLPQGEAKVRAVDSMFDTIAPRYELMNRLLTFGMDKRWRRLTVESLQLPAGSVVLDLACGTGDLCRELDAAGLHPVGVDRSAGMLAAARGEDGSRARFHGGGLVRGDTLRLPVGDGSADGAVCGFSLRNFLSLPPFLTECARVLRPGGRLALLEVATPANSVLRFGHSIYFERVVPVIGGLLSDRTAYSYLPRSVAYLPPDHEILAMLGQAGFVDTERRALSVGIAQLMTATRR
ncbi:MAG: ubiquinone/menaquinone biosynthesis methyltransferase [Actinomycetota bacterium]|nr:ubiquinone/menaquinone biosynthesis methyltransferase [Actinomycetota bacterium]